MKQLLLTAAATALAVSAPAQDWQPCDGSWTYDYAMATNPPVGSHTYFHWGGGALRVPPADRPTAGQIGSTYRIDHTFWSSSDVDRIDADWLSVLVLSWLPLADPQCNPEHGYWLAVDLRAPFLINMHWMPPNMLKPDGGFEGARRWMTIPNDPALVDFKLYYQGSWLHLDSDGWKHELSNADVLKIW